MTCTRRRFVFGLTALPFLVSCTKSLTGPEQTEEIKLKSRDGSLVDEGSVADFLARRGLWPVFDDRSAWDFGDDFLLLVALSTYGPGNYHYKINGRLIMSAINTTMFDHRRQKMTIIKDGQVVWSYKPGRRPDIHVHCEFADDPL